MRILHFGGFYSDRFAGLERHVDYVLRGLQSHCESGSLVGHDRYAATEVDEEGYGVKRVITWRGDIARQKCLLWLHRPFLGPTACMSCGYAPWPRSPRYAAIEFQLFPSTDAPTAASRCQSCR